MMKDKDCREVLKLTLPYFEKVITVKAADMPRAISAQELMELSADLCFNVTAANNYSEALDIALSNNNRVFIFGSLYLASGIRPLLETK